MKPRKYFLSLLLAASLISCASNDPRNAFLGASDPMFRGFLIKELDARGFDYRIEEDGHISYPTEDKEEFQIIVEEVVRENYVENPLRKL